MSIPEKSANWTQENPFFVLKVSSPPLLDPSGEVVTSMASPSGSVLNPDAETIFVLAVVYRLRTFLEVRVMFHLLMFFLERVPVVPSVVTFPERE